MKHKNRNADFLSWRSNSFGAIGCSKYKSALPTDFVTLIIESSPTGKRAIVTGAGKGIGKAVALRLAECGAVVTAISRTQSDLDELSEQNGRIKPLCLDVGNWEATKTAVEKLGPVDLLVNNAGIYSERDQPRVFGSMTEHDIDVVYNINVKAAINISQVVAASMISAEKGGSIVNVSSIGSTKASMTNGIYGSSKAALDQITRNMAEEYGVHNIRVNSVNPGPIHTKMTEFLFNEENIEIKRKLEERTPLKRIGEVDDVAYPILFLLSDYASLITGITMPIDGGLSNSY